MLALIAQSGCVRVRARVWEAWRWSHGTGVSRCWRREGVYKKVDSRRQRGDSEETVLRLPNENYPPVLRDNLRGRSGHVWATGAVAALLPLACGGTEMVG